MFQFRLNQYKSAQGEYDIEIVVPDNYPDSPPYVRETCNIIPDDFHTFKQTGCLCLGAPVEVRSAFAQHGTLRGFIDYQIIPLLHSYSYFAEHGEMPFGELMHGIVGLIQYYSEFFEVRPIVALKLLKLLADNSAPPLMPCPCGSSKELQDCHGPKLDELRPHYTPEQFEGELRDMIAAAQNQNVTIPERHVLPRKMWKQQQRKLRQKRRKRGHMNSAAVGSDHA